MTTYRRFCCNDLLRMGTLNLDPGVVTFVVNVYSKCLAIWPGNCHVADTPGGLISGYIFGSVCVEEGTVATGWITALSFRSLDMIDVAKCLNTLLEEHLDKTYRAYKMMVFVTHSAVYRYIAEALGFVEYRTVNSGVYEFVKPLRLLLEETERRVRSLAGLVL